MRHHLTAGGKPGKFPVENGVDHASDCDDRNLIADLISREGYSVALFYVSPENHMMLGIDPGND